jgi:hypothetical protein
MIDSHSAVDVDSVTLVWWRKARFVRILCTTVSPLFTQLGDGSYGLKDSLEATSERNLRFRYWLTVTPISISRLSCRDPTQGLGSAEEWIALRRKERSCSILLVTNDSRVSLPPSSPLSPLKGAINSLSSRNRSNESTEKSLSLPSGRVTRRALVSGRYSKRRLSRGNDPRTRPSLRRYRPLLSYSDRSKWMTVAGRPPRARASVDRGIEEQRDCTRHSR